jgi:hypothetical protein
MAQHLKVSLQLAWISGTEYRAKVVTRVLDSCYKAKSIQSGLPAGMVGIPEYEYITVEFTHEGEHCAEVVTYNIQEIDKLDVSTGKIGVTVVVLVNGEYAGSDHYKLPRLNGNEVTLPIEFDFSDASEAPSGSVDFKAAGMTCNDFDLLKIKGWPETKTVMEKKCVVIFRRKICSDVPHVYTRNCELHVTATVCHPNLAEIIGDVESCLKQAAVAGVIVGLVSESAEAASATLGGYLKACLLARGVKQASDISVNVNPHSTSCSAWH